MFWNHCALFYFVFVWVTRITKKLLLSYRKKSIAKLKLIIEVLMSGTLTL